MAAMKWFGWGEDDVAFTHEDKPALGPFLRRALDLDVSRKMSRPPAFGSLEVPEPVLPAALADALANSASEVSTEPLDRVVHARGKSLRDLVRHRRGDLGRLPDAVVRPAGEDEVAAVMRTALDADAVLIPFGGGTSISGSLEAPHEERRSVRRTWIRTPARTTCAPSSRKRSGAAPCSTCSRTPASSSRCGGYDGRADGRGGAPHTRRCVGR
jgi:alkyldihydroxyacetonephosphate synthase